MTVGPLTHSFIHALVSLQWC